MEATQLFVFAGAGLSFESGLPGFDAIKGEVLEALRLAEYQPGGALEDVQEGVAPEAFMSSLERSSIDVHEWLSGRLATGEPGWAHLMLAALAGAGARVWTVNFDELIEQAAAGINCRLRVSAWPDAPAADATLFKPHGTISGEIVATADAVLLPLAQVWRRQLERDVADRHAIFFGYSGRDLDLRPIWREVLGSAVDVTWIDVRGSPHVQRTRALLSTLEAAGRMSILENDRPVVALASWLRDRDVALPDEPPIPRPARGGPAPPFSRVTAARLRELLGDIRGARLSYIASIPRSPVAGIRGLAEMQLNHGGLPTGFGISAGAALARLAGRRGLHARLERKRLNILVNSGRPMRVLAATADYETAPVSTIAILRAAALRVTDNLDTAAEIARFALDRARAEKHKGRAANAGYQLAQSLVWASRLDEAEDLLLDECELVARLGGNRWIGWQTLLLGAIDARRQPERTLVLVDQAIERFKAEALLDGQLAALQVKAVALRAAGELESCAHTLHEIDATYSTRGRFYLRRSEQSQLWATFERGELRRSAGDRTAIQLFRQVHRNGHPVQAALGLLGIAATELQHGGDHTTPARGALAIAERVGARYQASRARLLLDTDRTALAPIVFA